MPRSTPSLGFAVVPAAILITMGLAGAAGAAKIKVASDPEGDFGALRTYCWRENKTHQGTPHDRRIRSAADEVLAKKGLRKVSPDADPDLRFEYNIGVLDSLYLGLRAQYAWFGYVFLEPVGRSSVEAGILVLVSEAASDKAIWAGLVEMRGNNPQALQVMADRAGPATAKILKRYPKLD